MKKSLISVLAVVTLLNAGVASAQTYYPYSSGGSCVNLSRDLSVGSQGSDVTQLQTFLVNQNYPGGGSWMVTGYFGAATQAALRNFQGSRGLPQTGAADSQTRAALAQVTCGSQSIAQNYPYLYSPYNYNYGYNYNNGYNYNYNYGYPNYGQTLSLTTLSQNTGAPGQQVTIHGTGFDPVGNTVHFGSQDLTGIPSQGGTSLTFTIPAYYTYTYNQDVQLTVSNSHGTSNALSFRVAGYPYGCNQYGYNYGYNYNYNYGNNCYQYQTPYQNISQPVISYLQPAQGGVGTSVTIIGTGFTTSNNTVHFGNGIISGLNSPDGQSVSFTVPQNLTGFGSQVVTLGTYQVSVTNAAGYTTNTMPFSVTSLGSSGAPTITSVNGPTSIAAGTQGSWSVVVHSAASTQLTTSVTWGDESTYGYSSAQPQSTLVAGQTTLTFTHTYQTSGTYTVTFTVHNAAGQSNTSSVTVTVTGSAQGTPSISSLAPNTGSIGSIVTIYGTGFTTTNNTIHFGNGVIQNAYSSNGISLSFTVPQYITPYCYSVCPPPYTTPTQPGPYNVSVQNQNGTSNTLVFQVQ